MFGDWRIIPSMVVFGSRNWQVCHTTYIPLIVLAEPGRLYATYHLLREPETTIDPSGCKYISYGDRKSPIPGVVGH